jgi:hypothetical protein
VKLTSAKSLAFAAILSATLMLSLAYYWPIQEAYHPLNPDWNGCSKVANATLNLTLLFSYRIPLPNQPSLLAIIGPSTIFTKDEIAEIRSFLEAGGTVLLADDFGTGNTLLKGLNVSAQFSGKPLADLYYYSKAPRFPLIGAFSPSPITANVTTVVLNRPSYIDIANSSLVTKLASSSPFSFVDLSGNGRPSPNETINSYPVMAAAKIGRGTLILISDPSMFVNDMIDLNDNMQLFRNLIGIGHGSLFFDVVHLSRAPLTDWRIMLKGVIDSFRLSLFSSESNRYVQPIIVILALGLVFSVELIRVRRSKRRSR